MSIPQTLKRKRRRRAHFHKRFVPTSAPTSSFRQDRQLLPQVSTQATAAIRARRKQTRTQGMALGNTAQLSTRLQRMDSTAMRHLRPTQAPRTRASRLLVITRIMVMDMATPTETKWKGRVVYFAVVFLSLSAAACAPRDAGFSDVRSTIRARLGHDVAWDSEGESAAMPEAVRRLLQRPLDSRAAVQIALLNNRSLAAAFQDLGVARAELVQASSLPNPTVEGAYRFSDQEHEEEYEFGALIDVVDLILLPGRRGAAAAALRAAKLRVAGAVMDLAFAVRSAFYRFLADTQQRELRRTVLEASAASYETAQQLHRAGNITDLDLANEQSLFEESRLALAEAELRQIESREQLNTLMGLWGRATAWRSVEGLAQPRGRDVAADALERRAISRSLDLAEARLRYESLSTSAGVAGWAGVLPNIALGISAESEDDGLHYGPAAEVTLPLFNQGQGERGVAVANARRVRQQYIALAVNIRSTTRAAKARLDTARQRVVYFREVMLPLRERIVRETQLQYNAMEASVFQLLQAKRDQIDAGRQYVEALYEYWRSRAELDQILAGRLPRTSGRASDRAGERGASATSSQEAH